MLCYVKGEHYNHAFPVEIEKEKWVADLKKAIKVEKSPWFDHIPADSLVLWKVSVLHDSDLAENVNKLTLIDEDGSPQVSMVHPDNEQIPSLSTVHKLSKVLSEPPMEDHVDALQSSEILSYIFPSALEKKTVYIIVKPPPALSAAKEIDMGEKDDILTALKTSPFLPFNIKILS